MPRKQLINFLNLKTINNKKLNEKLNYFFIKLKCKKVIITDHKAFPR